LLDTTKPEGGRNWLVLATGLYLGLRVSEICSLRIRDLDLSTEPNARVNRGKSGKDRLLPMPTWLAPSYRRWIATKSASSYLFPGRRSARIGRRTLEYAVQACGHAASIPALTPHTLRHTYATMLLTAGVPLTEVSELLGHSDVATTAIYLHVLPERLRGAVETLRPPQRRMWAVSAVS
jgi:integrase/recombinase XerD